MRALHPPATSPLRLGAVVLAAGAARRMGGWPKCLLERDGEALIQRLLRALAEINGPAPVVVLGHHADRIAASLRGLAYTAAVNPDPEADQASSLRVGLRALPGNVDAVMVLLADQPLITAQDLRDLVSAYDGRPSGTSWVQPSVNGLPGNPVMFSSDVRAQLIAELPARDGQHWRRRHPQAVHLWPTQNAHYRTDVDSPEDIQTLGECTGQWLRWPDDLVHMPPSPHTPLTAKPCP